MMKKMVVFHYACLLDGQYVRVRQNVELLKSLGYTDVLEIRITSPFLKRRRPDLNWSLPISEKMISLGVLLPLRWSFLPWLRFLDKIITFFVSLLVSRVYKPDLVLCETDVAAYYVKYMSKFMPNAQIIYDVHGASVEEYEFLSAPHTNQKIKKWIADRCLLSLEYAGLVLCQSRAMALYIQALKKGEEPWVYPMLIDNSWRISLDEIMRERVSIRSDLNIHEDAVVFVYAGGLAKWQKIEETLAVFRRYHSRFPDCRLIFLTNEIKRDWMPQAIRPLVEEGAMKILTLNHGDVSRYLCAADVAFLLRDDILLNRVASPTKLGEYLSRGLLVVSEKVSENWLYDEDCSFSPFCIIDLSNEKTIVQNLKKCIDKIDLSFKERVVKKAWTNFGENENDEVIRKKLTHAFLR